MHRLLTAALLATPLFALAAPPQATPAQCKPDSENFEACLQKAGVRNFTRNKGTLTVLLEGGKTARFADNRSDGDDYAAYTYQGYQPETGLHQVSYSGYEWGGVVLIDHQSGSKTLRWSRS